VEKQKNTITIKIQKWLYALSIGAYRNLIHLASLRSDKAKKWIIGRKDWRADLRDIIDPQKCRILVHAASLGEMEQGLPILKLLRTEYPDFQIILSFYSPSGYEHFSERELCDAVIYLPEDSPSNARDFARILKADLALFVKYEIWPNLIESLKKEACSLILAPAVFRPKQLYFKAPSKNWFTKSLARFDHILVQNKESADLLKNIGIKQVSICGDSRFERALDNKAQEFSSTNIKRFIGKETNCLIVGSSWPKEEEMCLRLLQTEELQLILAPHDVSSKNIARIVSLFQDFEPSLYSDAKVHSNSRVLIIDGIGKLKYIYRYADIAFIGGGFGDGVHSTVEAAVYQLPILFGPKHEKFPETLEMQTVGIAKSVKRFSEFQKAYAELLSVKDEEEFKDRYIQFLGLKTGASQMIFKECRRQLKLKGEH